MFGKDKYSTTLNFIDANNISVLKERVKILLVDDENDEIEQILNNRKYCVYYKSDINYAIEAEPFDVIFIDIKGVAKRIKSPMEGFQMAKEIKQRYPMKKVYCFSGTVNEMITEEISNNVIDGFIVKDQDFDKWSQKLDVIIKECFDKDKIWEALEKELKNRSISNKDIDDIKKTYYKSFETKSFSKLYDQVMSIIKDASTVITILSSIVNIMKFFVA